MRWRTSQALLVFCVVLLLAVVPRVRAVEPKFTVKNSLNTYAETKVVVKYSFTQNVTSNAYSAGQSVWKATVGPESTVFTTDAADKFTWHLEIKYGTTVAQTVSVAVFSGNQPVDSREYEVAARLLSFDFDITVTEQPHYPTAEELADKSIQVLGNRLEEYVAEMREQNRISRQYIAVFAVISLVSFGGFAGYVLLPYVRRPKRGEEG